jgi:hypothetical protein
MRLTPYTKPEDRGMVSELAEEEPQVPVLSEDVLEVLELDSEVDLVLELEVSIFEAELPGLELVTKYVVPMAAPAMMSTIVMTTMFLGVKKDY